MKKVLMLANHASTIYLLRTELVEQMRHRGYEIYISSPYGDKMDALMRMGCQFIETEVERRETHIKKDAALFLKYIKMIRKIRPDIVLSYTVKPNLYGGIASRICKVPYIPNVTGLGSGFMMGGIVQSVVKLLSYISFRGAYKVMIQNQNDLSILRDNHMVRNNYDLIPGSGVNINTYNVLPYPDKQRPIVFNFIARVMKDKGIDEYLKAARIIKRKYPYTIFNVIGMIDQEEYKEILESYEQQKIIQYYSFQKDMKPLYKMCSCTINPSHTEGMSNVLLESAASGRPVIASNIPGCREIVDEGKNGYLFECGSVAGLVAKIEEFIQLDYKDKVRMGLAGREKVIREFDREKVIEIYINEISFICAHSSSQAKGRRRRNESSLFS